MIWSQLIKRFANKRPFRRHAEPRPAAPQSLKSRIVSRYLITFLIVSVGTALIVHWLSTSAQKWALELSYEQTRTMMMQAIRDEVRYFNLSALTESLHAFQKAMMLDRVEVNGPYGLTRAAVGVSQDRSPDDIIDILSNKNDIYGQIRLWGGDQSAWAAKELSGTKYTKLIPFAFLGIMFVSLTLIFARLIQSNIIDPLTDLRKAIDLSGLHEQRAAYTFSDRVIENAEFLEIANTFQVVASSWAQADAEKASALRRETMQRELMESTLESAGLTIVSYSDERENELIFQGAAIDSHLRRFISTAGLKIHTFSREAKQFGLRQIKNASGLATSPEKLIEYQTSSEERWRIEKVFYRKNAYALLIANVTEQRQVERMLSAHEREVALAHLTSGIAHDFNNILAIITGALDILRYNGNEGISEYLDMINEASDRAKRYVSRLNVLEYKDEQVTSSVEQKELLRALAIILPASLGTDMKLTIDAKIEWPVVGREDEFETCMVNFIFNARDALQGVGHIRVSTRMALVDELKRFKLKEKKYIAFDIVDSGPGVDESLSDKIFQQFFTTKPSDAGSGLGLSQNQNFAQRNGGVVYLRNPGEPNAHFVLVLPVSESLVMQAHAPAATLKRDIDLTGCRIAIFDDQVAVGGILELCLSEFGAETTYSENMAEFQRRLQSEKVDVILSDVHMPFCTFNDVYDVVQQYAAAAHLVFISGDPRALDKVKEAYPDVSIVQKPFNVPNLAQSICSLKHKKAASAMKNTPMSV